MSNKNRQSVGSSTRATSGDKFDPKAAEAHVLAFSKAFARDSFDAKSLTAGPSGAMASHGATRMAAFYETVTPLLTPDQRTTLAEHLRKHANYVPAAATGK